MGKSSLQHVNQFENGANWERKGKARVRNNNTKNYTMLVEICKNTQSNLQTKIIIQNILS